MIYIRKLKSTNMKQLLLLFSLILMNSFSSLSQCTPDPQYTNPGVYPDSATGFSSGCLNQFYTQVVTNVVPVDTTVEPFPGFPVTLDFDSIVITSFTGLPAGVTYECNDSQNVTSPANGCAFEGGTTGCVLLSGTPTVAGTYNLVITVDVYVAGGTTPQTTETIDYYSIVIDDCTSGIKELEANTFNMYPNPSSSLVTIDGLTSGQSKEIIIENLEGKVMERKITVSTTEQVDISHLSSGIYLVKVMSQEGTSIQRLVKN